MDGAMTQHPPSSAVETIPPALLLSAYAQGIFPMADDAADDAIYWIEPERRAILPLDALHLSRKLRRKIAADHFSVTSDRAFGAIMDLCAQNAPDRPTTWINPVIHASYRALHAMGHAHSVELWQGDALVGGLYGVSLGRAFFGESMVSRARDASKIALAHLVARLRVGGFVLLDCQFMTDHLRSMGAVEMPQSAYLNLLQSAVFGEESPCGAAAGAAGAAVSGDWGALDAALASVAAGAGAGVAARAAGGAASPLGTGRSPGQLIVQLLTNTS